MWVNLMEDQAPPCPSVQVFKTVRRRFRTPGSSAGANQGDQRGHADATPVSGTAPTSIGWDTLHMAHAIDFRLPPRVAETFPAGPEEAGPHGDRFREQERRGLAHSFQRMHALDPHSRQPTYSQATTPPSEAVHPASQSSHQWPQSGPSDRAPFHEERPGFAEQLPWDSYQWSRPQGPKPHDQLEPLEMRNGLQGEHLPQDPADPVTSSPQLWQPQSERPESQSLPVLQLPTYLPPQTWQHQQGKYHPPKSEPDFYEILGREETFGGALLSRQNVGAMNQGWTDDERRLMQDLLGCMLPSADDAALMRKVSHLRAALDEESRMKALSCHDAETLRLRVYDLEARNAALDTQLHALMTSAGDISGEAALAAAQEVWRRAFESARAENQSETNLTKARLAEGLEAERGERERLVMEAAQSRLLYRAKGRQFRTVREELAASERRGEELERGIVGLRNEVEGWQRRVELLEAELRICGEELGGCREEVENAHAVGGAAEERWRGEEARRKEAELEVECLEERIRQLESHDTGALLRRYDQQLQQTRAGFHTERARLQATIRDLQRELAEVRNEAAERGVEQPGGLDEGGVNAGISNGICGARFGEIGFGANEVRAGTEGSDGGGMAPKIASQDAKREAAEAKERAQELEKRINELHRETAMLRERLDEAKKAEFRRGELEEEAARLRERCADLERGLENERSAYSHRVERLEQERSAYSHQVERLEKERAAHAHQVEWLEKERRAHSHQTEQLTHQVWALQKELPAVEAKADGSAGCENAQQGKDAGKNEAAQKTEDRKPREGFGSAPAHLLPGGTERLGWEAPEAANLAESGDRHLQDWKDGTALERMELDNAALRTGGLRFGGIDRAMWSGEQESDRSMLLGAAQEEIEKLQEVNGRLMEALRAAQRNQEQQARMASDRKNELSAGTDKGHAAISPSFPADSQITTPTEPFDKTLHEQLFVAKADGQKAWAEVEAGRQRLAQLEEKLLAGRSLFARQEDLFRDLRKEVDEGKTRLETQAEAFREVREELLAAREELDVSRRLLRQMVPGVERKDAESWVAGKEREKKGEREGADLEGEKGVFGGQLLRGDDEPPERGEWSPQQGETNGDQGATFVDQTNGAHVDRKDCAGEVGDDVSKESMRARAGSSEEHGEPLTGWAEETEENQVEVPELRVEAERDVQFEGRAVAGGTTSAAGVRKAGEHSDWDAIERESELLLRSIEQAHGEGDASGIASGDESVNGVSDAGVNGQREGDIHWVGEESASGPGEGVNRLQVGSVNGRPSESVAESTSSVQGHVGATSAPRETASVEPSEVGKSREVGKEEGYRWESAEEDSEEEAAGPSFVKLTGLPGEQERRRPSESRSMQSSSPNPAVCDKSSSPQESPAGRDPPSRSSKAAPANRLPAVSNTETQSADLPPETLPSEQLSLTTVTTGGPESDAGRKTRRESNASDETARESGLATELGRGKRNRNGAEAESPASGATEGDSIADVIAILGDEATLCHEADAGWPPGGDAGPRPKAKGPLQMVQRRASEAEKGLGEEVRGSGRPEPMGEKVSSAKGSNDVWRTENRVTKLFQRDQNGEAEGFARERLGVNYGRGKGVQTGSAPKTEKKSDRPVSGNGNVAEASLPFTKRRPVGYDANAVLRRVRKREKREREALREIRAANGTEPESGVPGKTGTNRQQLRDGGVGSTTLGKEVRSRKVMRASRRMSPFGDPNVLKPVRSTGAGRGLQEDGLSLQQGCPEIKIAEVSVLAAGKPKVDLPLNSELVRKRDDGMVGLRVSELHRERSKLQLALAMKHAQRAAAGLGIEA